VLPHVFEKFVRGRVGGETRADGGEGTGLGLAIAKGIMEAHHGKITAQSPTSDGYGTRIVLDFPRTETPA
jgi:two-component system sensor histidine kinase KdpD